MQGSHIFGCHYATSAWVAGIVYVPVLRSARRLPILMQHIVTGDSPFDGPPTSLAAQGYWTGGFEDNSVAVALHQRAAEQGNVEALLSVGDSFWYGRGAPRDWRRAAEVYTAASKLQSSQVRRYNKQLTVCLACTKAQVPGAGARMRAP